MRVVVLGSAACIHSVRLSNGLSENGLDVHLISVHPKTLPLSDEVTCHILPHPRPHGYVLNKYSAIDLIRSLAPDVVNSHYASGYGLLGRLIGYRPTVLSVWGSDVFDFPLRSFLHKKLLRKNLEHADAVSSTSRVMAKQCQDISQRIRRLEVIPFGVETSRFSARKTSGDAWGSGGEIVVGTVKKLAPTYGIDILLKGFARCLQRLRNARSEVAGRLRLRIVGEGEDLPNLQALSEREGIKAVTEFVGAVPHERVPAELCKLDVYVAVSRRESFGVAIVEALAAERPVIVSDVGGLPEVVKAGETGLVVPRESPEALADALIELLTNKLLCDRLAQNGRRDVQSRFEWRENVNTMEHLLRDVGSRGLRSPAA